MKRLLFIALSFIVYSEASGQDGLLPLEHFSTVKAETMMKANAESLHPELKPYNYWDIQQYSARPDSAGYFEELPHKRGESSYLSLTPLITVSGFNQGGSNFKQGIESFGGLAFGGGVANKFYFHINGLLGFANPPSYYNRIVDSLSVTPSWGYAKQSRIDNRGYDFEQLTGHIAFKPAEFAEIYAGRGRHFIGEGYRSMFLSDFSSNYNYLRADVNVWRLKYMVLYTQMKATADYPNNVYPLLNKYSTMHYISMNVTKWWSVGAFEAVVWESEDSVINRGYDINYLNPLIFFRPVEYGLGSSDNSLLGFSSTVRPLEGLTLYGQFLLDDIVFGEWLAPVKVKLTGDSTLATGWWANKQSYQLGIKYHEPFGWKDASVLAEVNIVRPFTYGHSNRAQSFTHLNLPLAHPLGANFIEWVQVTTWQPKRMEFGLFTTYSRKGYSNNIGYLGDDILVSNVERDDDNREHGNFLLQGRRIDVANIRLVTGYTLVENWNLKAEASIHYRLERGAGYKSDMFLIGLGIRTALWNNYRNL